jgi:hypothetical protein
VCVCVYGFLFSLVWPESKAAKGLCALARVLDVRQTWIRQYDQNNNKLALSGLG